MKTAILVTPTSISIPKFEKAHYIGVDAGALLLIEQGFECSFAVGDFDSLTRDDFQRVKEHCEVICHPIMKNETDSELAIMTCIERGYDSIYLYGALSKRLDHTIANIRLMMYRFPNVICLDEMQQIRVLEEGVHRLENLYKHVSFFPIEPSIVSLDGFLYPLDNQQISCEDIYCTSNTILDKNAYVTVKKGRILCVESNNR